MKHAVLGLILVTIAMTVPGSAGNEIPSSARSREVIRRVSPVLKQALAKQHLKLGDPIFIRIFKAERELEVWVKSGETFTLFRTYPICTFSGGPGPKTRQGDRQAPEGFYFVRPSQMNPASRFHLAFNLGYPNAYDRAHGYTGSLLMVHGNCVSIGCYAMTDKYIEEIYTLADAALRHGQPFFRVHAFPFRMTDSNMLRAVGSPFLPFWKNLKDGYDRFEKSHIPPDVMVRNKRYCFREQ